MGYPDGYLEQIRMQNLGSAAAELLKLGFAADAAMLFNESIGLAKDIPADSPNYIGNRDGLLRQHRDGLTRALDELKPEDLASSLNRMITGSEAQSSKKTAGANQVLSTANEERPATEPGRAGASSRARQGDDPKPAGRLRWRPLVVGRRPTSVKARDQLAATLEASRKMHPDDVSLAITESLLALGSGETTRIEPALARLGELVEKAPLEVLGAGTRANARQRAQAARQIPLWLVARACWKQKNAADFQVVAQKLAARARRRRDVSRRTPL